MKPLNPLDWQAFHDGDSLEFDGSEPAVVTVRSLGAAGVYLDQDGRDPLLVGVGESEEFTVSVLSDGPCRLRLMLQVPDLPAAYTARGTAPQVQDLGASESLVVIKPRIQESEDMRNMRKLLRQQAELHQRQLTELQNAGTLKRNDTHGAARVPDADGQRSDSNVAPGGDAPAVVA